jgi:cation transport ATPase
MNHICFSSSFFFLITAVLALYSKYYVYGILLLLLLITSIIFHTWTTNYTLLLDKVSIIAVVLYGAYLFYRKSILNSLNARIMILQILVLLTFFITIYLYYYGYYNNQYCFDKDINTANLYHSLLHFISFYGHNIIIIM